MGIGFHIRDARPGRPARRRARIAVPALILLLGAGLHGGFGAEQARSEEVVELAAEARVDGDYVRLGDVAAIRGARTRVAALGRVFLGVAPDRGRIRSLDRAWIERRLRELGRAGDVRLTGAETVVVRRSAPGSSRPDPTTASDSMNGTASTSISDPADQGVGALPRAGSSNQRAGRAVRDNGPKTDAAPQGGAAHRSAADRAAARREAVEAAREASRRKALEAKRLREARDVAAKAMICAAVRTYLEKRLRYPGMRAQVEVLRMSELPPTEATEMTVLSVPRGRLPGSGEVVLAVKIGPGRPATTCTARLRVEVEVPVWTPRRPLARGERIQSHDFVQRYQSLAHNAPIRPFDPASVEHWEAVRDLQPGTAVDMASFRPTPMVRKGKPIKITATQGLFSVSETVVALEDGNLDDLVRVQPIMRKSAPYVAKVTGRDHVALAVGGAR